MNEIIAMIYGIIVGGTIGLICLLLFLKWQESRNNAKQSTKIDYEELLKQRSKK